MAIGASSTVAGDVTVRQIEPLPALATLVSVDGGAPPPSSVPQLLIGAYSHVATDAACNTTGTVSSNSMELGAGACAGDVRTNQLRNPSGTVGSHAPFPTKPLDPLPFAGMPTGGAPVTVVASSSASLTPGAYGDSTVGQGGTLTLAAGSYSFGAMHLAGWATLTTSASGVSIVASSLTVGQVATVTPQSGLHAGALQIQLAGAATFAKGASVKALVAAPHGDMTFGAGVTAAGAFAAFTIETKDHVSVTLDSGFPPPAHGTQQLSGYYGQQLNGAFGAVSPVERDKVFALSIGLPIPNLAALHAFIDDVSNPHSPNYRHFITPAAFKTSFGASDADYHALERWAVAHGLTIERTYSNNLLLTVTGTAAVIERALYVNLMYRKGGPFAPGFLAVDREPSLNLGPAVLWITGFTDSRVPQAGLCNPVNPVPGGVSGGLGFLFSASDVRQAYLGNGACQPLTGVGQTIGILQLEPTNLGDRAAFIASQPAGSAINFTGNVSFVTNGSAGELSSPSGEAALDLEAVSAMAPAANVKIFQTPVGITSHADDAYHEMATDGTLTVGTSSWNFGRSDNSQQALTQMAAEGISFFNSSGDYGDVGDPQSNQDMDDQTLVGGTSISGSGVRTLFNPATNKLFLSYTLPYWAGETTWNGGCAGTVDNVATLLDATNIQKDITGGGVMNGQAFSTLGPPACYCFPSPSCCGSGVPLPGYQKGVKMSPVVRVPGGLASPAGGNGGSTSFRDFPDVAAAAASFQTVFTQPQCATLPACPPGVFSPRSCCPIINGASVCCIVAQSGTSLSAPLWAGFAALVNEQSKANGNPNKSGFLNDTIYPIGLTRGLPGAGDLYTPAFHDIADGVFNQDPQPNTLGLGFPAVGGYDLATGWGSPSCALLRLLSSASPLTPQAFSQVYAHIESGPDGLNDATSVDLVVNTTDPNLAPPPFHVKLQGEAGWGDGTTHDLDALPLPAALNPAQIASVTVTLFENGQGGSHADNWDLGGIQVRLGTAQPGAAWGCLVDVSGNGSCDANQPSCHSGTLGNTSDTGAARLSETVSDSGQGPSATFLIANEGCAAWNPGPAQQPFDSIEVVVDTSDDDLGSGDQLDFRVFDSTNTQKAFQPLHNSGAAKFDNNTEHSVRVAVPQLPSSAVDHLTLALSNEGNDEWHVNGISIFGRRIIAGGQDTCLYRSTGKIVMNSGLSTLTLSRGSGCP